MKKIIYIFIGCLLLTSCSGMLDIESHSAVSPGSVTPQDLSALRMGMYNKVQNSPTRESYITFDILGGDLTQSTGNVKDLINSVLSSLNSIVASSWNGYYNALYQVNNVLSIVESLPESELRNLIIGEAHYFRAYIYHALVTRWGGVPIQKVNTMEKPFRDSEEAVWSFIEEELQTALAFLGTSSSYYYVSRDAALALKARVMLERGNLTEAATLAEGLITDGKYKLDSFDKIFRGKSNTEVIFSFQCLAEESNITISTLFYTYAHPNHGSYVYRPTNEVMNMYDDKDKRKEVSIINVGSEPCINKYPSGQTGTDPVVNIARPRIVVLLLNPSTIAELRIIGNELVRKHRLVANRIDITINRCNQPRQIRWAAGTAKPFCPACQNMSLSGIPFTIRRISFQGVDVKEMLTV